MKERYGSGDRFPPWTRHEHQARYHFASGYVQNAVVVDAACGDGTGSALYAGAGARSVLAFDIAADCIRTAQERFHGKNIKFEISDCSYLRLGDGTADVYISLETIEHLVNDGAFLKEAVRVLKPDGTLICSTPNRDVTNPGGTLESKPLNPFHLREYSLKEFEGLLGRFFKKIEFYGQNRMSGPMKTAVRWLKKLQWLLHDRPEYHRVLKLSPGDRFEFLVAVCTQPMRSPDDAVR